MYDQRKRLDFLPVTLYGGGREERKSWINKHDLNQYLTD